MFCLVAPGTALITSSIYDYCVVKQKEFSRKVEMSKVQSFYWNKLGSKSFPFESEQCFVFCFSCWGGGGGGRCTDNIQHIPLQRVTKLIVCPTHLRNSMADTLILLDNTRKMSAKCLLILSIEMIFYFDGFANGQINKIS